MLAKTLIDDFSMPVLRIIGETNAEEKNIAGS